MAIEANSASVDSGIIVPKGFAAQVSPENPAMRVDQKCPTTQASSENPATQINQESPTTQPNQHAFSQSIKKIEDVLANEGFYMGPPVGISMWPMLRNRRDVMLVVPAPKDNTLQRYDVALYRRDSSYVLHRVVGFYEKGYIICGDNCVSLERIPRENVLGVLQGFYRDGRYTPCATSRGYHAYSKLWVALFPVRRFCKSIWGKAKHLVKGILIKLGLWKKRSNRTPEKTAIK